ncbi:MAG: hypothetical protein ACI31M_04225 [Bacilli bacterium]
MGIKDYTLKFDEIIYSSLYTDSNLSEEHKKWLEEISTILKNEKDLNSAFSTLITNATKENSYQYKNFITYLINNTSFETENILNNLKEYSDYSEYLFLKLKVNDILNYIENKKTITMFDMNLINTYIKNNKSLVSKIISNENIWSKFPKFSLEFSYSTNLEKYFESLNKELLNKCTPDTITAVIKGMYKKFKDFLTIKDHNILQQLVDNSLLFIYDDIKEIKTYIMKNPSIASKFNALYFEELTEKELNSLYSQNVINPYILKAALNNGENPNKVFSKENVSKCAINSINYNFLDLLDSVHRNCLLKDPHLLNRFNDYIVAEIISTYFSEEEIIMELRNPLFLNDISTYALELIVNNLSFRNLFNMIQNHLIFERINNLNTNVSEKDRVFVRGYLDSTILVHKSSSNMIYNMLLLVPANNVLEYLTYPYILEKINNKDLINLIIKNNIDFKLIIENDFIFKRLDTTDIVNYINELWTIKVDLDLIKNPKILKRLFNINDELLKKINFDEVNYLFDTIRMKDTLSIQESTLTVQTYHAVLSSYLTFGINKTIDIISNGNKDLTISIINSAINAITKEEVTNYRNNNYLLLQNIDKKIVDKLKDINITSINEFESRIMAIPYIESLIRLMVSTKFMTLSEIIHTLYNYKKYEDNLEARKELKEFCNEFVSYFLNNKSDEIKKHLIDVAKKNCCLKSGVIKDDYKKTLKEWLSKKRLELFIKSLQGEKNAILYKENYDFKNINNLYISRLNSSSVELDSIIENILIPLSKDEFDLDICLKKMNISKPKDYDKYRQSKNDLKKVKEINQAIASIKGIKKESNLLELLNYIVYGTDITNKKRLTTINKLRSLALDITGEVYIDKINMCIVYGNIVDIEDEEAIKEYESFEILVNTIIKKTKDYIKHWMDTKTIESLYYDDFVKYSKKIKYEHDFNSHYYEVKERIFSLKDLEIIFDGFDINEFCEVDKYLNILLFEKNILELATCGLFKNTINKLGYIISSWSKVRNAYEVLKIDISTLNIFDINQIVMTLNHNNLEELNYVINNISSDTYYYEIPDLKERINLLIHIYSNAKLINTKSVPMLGVCNEEYSLETLDYQDPVNYLISFDTDYRIGAHQNDLMSYSILSKDGIVLVIRDNQNNIVGRINGIRNGNTLFLTSPTLQSKIDIKDLLLIYSRKLVDYTKTNDEPINNVVISNYDIGINIDKSTCSYIERPVRDNDTDYKNLVKRNFIIKGNINDDFKNSAFTIIYSNLPINRDSFISYSAKDKYPRIRNEVIEINGICNVWQTKKIESIIKEYCLVNGIEMRNTDIENYEKIYLFDDAVILIDKEKNIYSYVLPYDERAIKEVEGIISTYKNEVMKKGLK